MSCTCEKCIRACQRAPGWMSPEEARKAIDNGYADRLMRDWFEPSSKYGNKERIYVLAPASLGCEGKDAPEVDREDLHNIIRGLEWNKGRCTFFNDEGRCEVHESGFKPLQCKSSY